MILAPQPASPLRDDGLDCRSLLCGALKPTCVAVGILGAVEEAAFL